MLHLITNIAAQKSTFRLRCRV